jgi:hypothetical protein
MLKNRKRKAMDKPLTNIEYVLDNNTTSNKKIELVFGLVGCSG